jgi:hypothetical protein
MAALARTQSSAKMFEEFDTDGCVITAPHREQSRASRAKVCEGVRRRAQQH